MHGFKSPLFWRPLIVLVLVLLPSIALGHPGHGSGGDSNSIMHYLTSPMHVVPAATVLVGLVVVIRWVLKSNSTHDQS